MSHLSFRGEAFAVMNFGVVPFPRQVNVIFASTHQPKRNLGVPFRVLAQF